MKKLSKIFMMLAIAVCSFWGLNLHAQAEEEEKILPGIYIPGVIKYSVVIPSFAVKIGDYLSFDLPGYNILKEYTNVAGKERTTAYVRNYSCEIALEYRIITPDNWGSSTPGSSMEEFGDPRISRVVMRRSATLGEINRSIRLTLPAAFVEPDDFDRMIKIQNVLGRKENSTVILQKRATGN